MATGRKPKPHIASWDNKLVLAGLYKMPGDRPRWRYTDNAGKVVVFTEPDEHRAVARFRGAVKPDTINVPVSGTEVGEYFPAGPAFMGRQAETLAADFWPWLRQLLIDQPAYVAKMTGIPELANLAHLPMPKAPIKLAVLEATYRKENPASDKAQREALSALDRLIKHSGATTLADLTQEKLAAFRADIEKTVPGPATRKAYYSRVKSILAFGLKMGMDAVQIRGVLDRCKILWTAAPMPNMQPKPISRDDFHVLLGAGNGSWRPWLLLGLNLCLHMEEVCGLRWADFDLEKGTYAAIREKTRRARIPRAATLWPETLAALKALPRRREYVFTSTHGTRYNKNTRVNDFADLRKAAKLPDAVTFDTLRDGAYTAAIQGAEEKLARVLAGHRSPGLQDSYVLRNPEFVRPACDAVYAAYFAPPAPKS